MVHLPRGIFGLLPPLPPASLPIVRHKNRYKKRTPPLREPLEAGRKNDAEGLVYIERGCDTRRGVFIKSPVKRNGIHSGGYSRIVRDSPMRGHVAPYTGESPGRLALVLEINLVIRVSRMKRDRDG